MFPPLPRLLPFNKESTNKSHEIIYKKSNDSSQSSEYHKSLKATRESSLKVRHKIDPERGRKYVAESDKVTDQGLGVESDQEYHAETNTEVAEIDRQINKQTNTQTNTEAELESLFFRYQHLESLLLDSQDIIKSQKNEISILKKSFLAQLNDLEGQLKCKNNQILLLEEEIKSLVNDRKELSYVLDQSSFITADQKKYMLDQNGVYGSKTFMGHQEPAIPVVRGELVYTKPLEEASQKQDESVSFVNQSSYSTSVLVEKIYRTDSKDIIVQTPVQITTLADYDDSAADSDGDKRNESPSIIIPKTPEKDNDLKRRHVDPNPVLDLMALQKPPPPPQLFKPSPPPSPQKSNGALSLKELIVENDRFIDEIKHPNWKPVVDNVDKDLYSRSPSPTKSMIIRERDQLEEELLSQYEMIRAERVMLDNLLAELNIDQ